jgi:hypothetical protein
MHVNIPQGIKKMHVYEFTLTLDVEPDLDRK